MNDELISRGVAFDMWWARWQWYYRINRIAFWAAEVGWVISMLSGIVWDDGFTLSFVFLALATVSLLVGALLNRRMDRELRAQVQWFQKYCERPNVH